MDIMWPKYLSTDMTKDMLNSEQWLNNEFVCDFTWGKMEESQVACFFQVSE